MADEHKIAARLVVVTQTEAQLRAVLDEILASRRALDRPLMQRLDGMLHGRVADALTVMDELSTVALPVLLDAAAIARGKAA